MNTTNKKLPVFASLEEEAAYWDTHGFDEQWNNGKQAMVVDGKKYSEGITVRFSPQVLVQLREKADKTGIATGSLIRMWILERLEQRV